MQKKLEIQSLEEEEKHDYHYQALQSEDNATANTANISINGVNGKQSCQRLSSFGNEPIRRNSFTWANTLAGDISMRQRMNSVNEAMLNVGDGLKESKISLVLSCKWVLSTVVFFISALALLGFALYTMSERISVTPLTPSYIIALLLLGIVLFIFSAFRMLKFCMFRCCKTKVLSSGIIWIFAPSKGVLLLCLAFAFAVLGVFGVWHISEFRDFSIIHYPIWLALPLLFIAVISLIAAIVYLFKYCVVIRFTINFWRSSSFYITVGLVIYDIVSDILAAAKVYVHHDHKFFVISVTFTCITFFMYWIVGMIASKDDRIPTYLKWSCYLPILSMITVSACIPGAGVIALIFSSFPQYIISLSFVLEHRILDTFNVMAIIMSLFQLLTSPLLTGSSAFYKTQVAEKMQSDDSDQNGSYVDPFESELAEKDPDKLDNVQLSYAWVLVAIAYLFVLLPILLLEIIHFCPVLFEYYFYENMSGADLLIYLLCFNVPKLLFLNMRAKSPDLVRHDVSENDLIIARSADELAERKKMRQIEQEKRPRDFEDYNFFKNKEFTAVRLMLELFKHGIAKERQEVSLWETIRRVLSLIIFCIVYILLFIILPLIPAVLFCLSFPVFLLSDWTARYDTMAEAIEAKTPKSVFTLTYDQTEAQKRALIETNLWAIYNKIIVKHVAVFMRKNIFILCLYLLIAYGSMARMLWAPGGDGAWTLYMLISTWVLAVYLMLLPIFAPQIVKILLKCASNISALRVLIVNSLDGTEEQFSVWMKEMNHCLNFLSVFIMCPCFVKCMISSFVEMVYSREAEEQTGALSSILFDEQLQVFRFKDRTNTDQAAYVPSKLVLAHVTDRFNNTFLHFIAKHGLLELIPQCADKIDINAKNDHGQTAYMVSMVYNQKNCSRLLREEYKCNVDDDWSQIMSNSSALSLYNCYHDRNKRILKCIGDAQLLGCCELTHNRCYYFETKLNIYQEFIENLSFKIGMACAVEKKFAYIVTQVTKKQGMLKFADQGAAIFGCLLNTKRKCVQTFCNGALYEELYFDVSEIDYYVPVCDTSGYQGAVVSMEVTFDPKNFIFPPQHVALDTIRVIDRY